jgi:drug/metabolite transporter superfamily protein YnfA
MGSAVTLLFLAVAALLEAGGDALVRAGLHAPSFLSKITFLVGGAVVLFAYGVTVNTPSWDFGRLLGVYVTLFFLAAQAINLLAFGVRPGLPIFIGGALIITGGLLITFWH